MRYDDLDGRTKLMASAAAQYLAGLPDVDQEAIDELVLDTLNGSASGEVNQGADLDEAHDAADALASEINNRGPEGQIAALMALGLNAADLDERLREAPGPGIGV